LVRRHPGDRVVVAATGVGLHALADDLRDAGGAGDRESLTILTNGNAGLESFATHLVYCDARLRQVVGGTAGALAVRVARAVLLEWSNEPPTAASVRAALDRVLGNTTPGQASSHRPRGVAVLTLLRSAIRKAAVRPNSEPQRPRRGRRFARLFTHRDATQAPSRGRVP
jgi:hypothetical protein